MSRVDPGSGPAAGAAALPVVAIVGRPNVGKSTLVNRFLGRREAIVEEKPGVTRDRKAVEAEWQGRPFVVLDTGGWMLGGSTLDAKVSAQAERAIGEADVVVMVVDVTAGVTDEDTRVARTVQRSARGPVLLVANKADDAHQANAIWEFVSLGLGEPRPVSALHGREAGDLLDEVVALLPPEPEPAAAGDGSDLEGEPGESSVAIVGRPNVGKSTLFNRLIGDERAIVHDHPGTTRDAIDTVVETEAGPIRFVDTAGMRRRARIKEDTEYYSMVRSLSAVDRSDVAVLVIDATQGVTHQDQRLAERVDGAGCPIVVLLNKWDLLTSAEERADVVHQVKDRLRFLDYAPVMKVSALSGKGVHQLLPALATAIGQYHRRVPTAELNRVVRDAQAAHPAPGGVRVLYATQGATDPPTITLFANREVPRTYLRFLENRIRDHFGFESTPLRIRIRRRTS